MRKKKQVEKMDSAVYTIVEAMKSRAMELKSFYDTYDLDPRITPLEPARLAVKRALLERGQTVPLPAPSISNRPTTLAHANSLNEGGGSNFGKWESVASAATAPGGNSSTHGKGSSSTPAGRTPDSILLKVILTEEEFMEVQRRRQAMQALVGDSRR